MAGQTTPSTLSSPLPNSIDQSGSIAHPHVRLLNLHKKPCSDAENGTSETADNVDGVLHVTIHHASDIHNICIYGNQDVYAKLSITHCQDAIYSTQPVKAGGKNPVFNQTLQIPICRLEGVLRCEIWMMSCARNYLEDQLLGFVLVPLKGICGKGKQTHDYCLTSTDLFYTPAGVVCLSLLFQEKNAPIALPLLTSHAASMDCGHQQRSLVATDLRNVEFPDLQVVSENQQLVLMYLKMAAGHGSESNGALFNGGGREICYETETENAPDDDEDTLLEDEDFEMVSPREGKFVEGSFNLMNNSHTFSKGSSVSGTCLLTEHPLNGNMSATAVSKQDDESSSSHPNNGHGSTDSFLAKGDQHDSSSSSTGQSPIELHDDQSKDKPFPSSQESEGSALPTSPLVNISVGVEVSVNQDQIVDLYMKSMQQFTEKLAEMNFSLDMEPQDIKNHKSNTDRKVADSNKEEGTKLYYGSRAFF